MEFTKALSLARQIKEDGFDVRDCLGPIMDGETDFEADNHRWIHTDSIDDILAEEISSDEYTLGCFNGWFIADVCGIDWEAVKAMQEAEAFGALGKLIISMGKVEEMAKAYVSADGYGHHFNSWDGNEIEIGDYHVFRLY